MKPAGGSPGLGARLRRVRSERGLSLRELGRLAGCSASLISQVERGQTAPSAGVIYGIANALGISLDYLFGVGEDSTSPSSARRADEPRSAMAANGTAPRLAMAVGAVAASGPGPGSDGLPDPDGLADLGPVPPPSFALPEEPVVQRRGRRRTIDLASGVRWERLTPQQDARVDFLEVVYQPFGRSTDSRAPIRHDGREYQLVLHGTLHADVGFETYVLEAGDSLAFDSATPHQYRNMSDQEVRVISVVVHHTA
ncbi:helix-turn-helix domain-containing protein [Streptomyces uncialis]|uniref:helix-turn-helix domain-containing protein n=1 Tax=Streptomyces uncialis TaxID=1048205 RepID=UPI003867E969|nr:XRE family transcriptional regulator [Streptomyces uncialis]